MGSHPYKDSHKTINNTQVFKHFEKCGFIVTGMLIEQIAADIEIYSAKWLMDAASEAVQRGKINNYKYVLGILQNWMSKGRSDSDGTRGNSPKDNFAGKSEYDTSRFSNSSQEWDGQLWGLGYSIDWRRLSIKHKGWDRAVRLKNIGITEATLEECFSKNKGKYHFYDE